MTKHRDKSNLSKGLFRAQSITAVWAQWMHTQEAESSVCWYSACFVSFIHSRSPAHGMVPSTFSVALPISFNPINTHVIRLEECVYTDAKSYQVDNQDLAQMTRLHWGISTHHTLIGFIHYSKPSNSLLSLVFPRPQVL